MPAIVELTLRPERRSGYVPTTVQLHGLACALFENGASGHDGQEKRFTVWPIAEHGKDWILRSAWLAPGMPRAVLASDGQVRVGPMPCEVTGVALDPVSFGELADAGPCGGAEVTFESPTYFAQNGARVVLPDPKLIVGSWRRRWNASVTSDPDLLIPDEPWHELVRALRLTEFGLRTERRENGYGKRIQGFTGTSVLRLDRGASEDARCVFGALARFAEFCGTGAQTTHGFGATSVVGLPG